MSPAASLIPAEIHEKYQVVEVRHAATILVNDLPREWSDIREVIGNFVLKKTDIEHSRKPDEMYDIIESCSPGPYVELFARHPRPGWMQWGNEI